MGHVRDPWPRDSEGKQEICAKDGRVSKPQRTSPKTCSQGDRIEIQTEKGPADDDDEEEEEEDEKEEDTVLLMKTQMKKIKIKTQMTIKMTNSNHGPGLPVWGREGVCNLENF